MTAAAQERRADAVPASIQDAISRERAFRIMVSVVGAIGLLIGIQILENGPIGANVPAGLLRSGITAAI